jgi:hypothetical protein
MEMKVGETKDLTPEEFENIEYSDSYKEIESEIVDQSRWETWHTSVYEKDGEFFRVDYSRGSTEYQDEGPQNITIQRVEKKEKIIWVYE